MSAILVVIVLLGADVKSDLNQKDNYFLNCNNPATEYWIENAQHQKIVDLARYELYQADFIHPFMDATGRLHDDGRRVRLYSKLGFTLDNIPTYDVRFYNEGIEIFRECEKRLPSAIACMKKNGQNTRSLEGLRFMMPETPVVDEKGYTHFWVPNGYT